MENEPVLRLVVHYIRFFKKKGYSAEQATNIAWQIAREKGYAIPSSP